MVGQYSNSKSLEFVNACHVCQKSFILSLKAIHGDRVLSACVGCASGKASFKRLQRWTLAEGRTVTATAKALH